MHCVTDGSDVFLHIHWTDFVSNEVVQALSQSC